MGDDTNHLPQQPFHPPHNNTNHLHTGLIIMDSTGIARWADAYAATAVAPSSSSSSAASRLFPDEQAAEIDRWEVDSCMQQLQAQMRVFDTIVTAASAHTHVSHTCLTLSLHTGYSSHSSLFSTPVTTTTPNTGGSPPPTSSSHSSGVSSLQPGCSSQPYETRCCPQPWSNRRDRFLGCCAG